MLGGPLACLIVNRPNASISQYLRHTCDQLSSSISPAHRSDSLSSPADVAVHFCNGNIAKAQPLIEGKKNPSDLIVEYDEGTSMRFLQSTASRMLASLFYIELASIPEFCSGLSLVHLRIRCRVPPGPSLIALLRLPLQNSQLYCWAETRDSRSSTSMKDGKQNKEPLAISTSVAQYQEGFSKAVTVEAKSLGSVIFVGITTKSGFEMISKCPYQIRNLIQDQGLNCIFGRKDHR